MLSILFCRPFRACYIISFTRGFTSGYVLSALRACCRAKRFFALHEKKRSQNEALPGAGALPINISHLTEIFSVFVYITITQGKIYNNSGDITVFMAGKNKKNFLA